MDDGTWLDQERRRQRRQWWATGAAAALVVLRVMLDDAPYAVLIVVVLVAVAFGLTCIVLDRRTLVTGTHDGFDAYWALPRADRRELRHSIRARAPIRPDLLDVAEPYARARVEQMRPYGWTAPGIVAIPFSVSTTWILAISVPALVVAVVLLRSLHRWTEQYAAVLAQQRSSAVGGVPPPAGDHPT